jgi:hypothetical protein
MAELLRQAGVTVKKLRMAVQEAHSTTPGKPVLHSSNLLGITRPGSKGEILDQDLEKL